MGFESSRLEGEGFELGADGDREWLREWSPEWTGRAARVDRERTHERAESGARVVAKVDRERLPPHELRRHGEQVAAESPQLNIVECHGRRARVAGRRALASQRERWDVDGDG